VEKIGKPMTKLTWLSHATWLIETEQHRVLLDPFFTDNPAAKVSADDFTENVSHILVSHGHFDHVADVDVIAKRCGSNVVANFEVASWFGEKGVESTTPMNFGGQIDLPFGKVKMVPAVHSSGMPDGKDGGNPAGFVLTINGKRIYFACDTAYFGDMKFYAANVDVAVLPIGDQFTMGVDDSIEVVKLIQPKMVLPTHYGTWPPIQQDANAWAKRVKDAGSDAKVLAVGESIQIV
jgi:L-ascorbate metabolism protein UlaG (beta-lactamase superfamily)